MRQHTKVLECLLQHEVMNNLKIQPTDDQIKDFKEKVYSLSSADYQEENINSVESEDAALENDNKELSTLNYLQKEEPVHLEIMLAIDTPSKGVNFQKRTKPINCNLCDEPFSTLSLLRKQTIKCLAKINSKSIEMNKTILEEDLKPETVMSQETGEVLTLDQAGKGQQDKFLLPIDSTNESPLNVDILPPHTDVGICDICCKTFTNRRYLQRHINNNWGFQLSILFQEI